MAMTKNEKAYLAALEHQVRLSRALRFTESVKPDLPPPNYMEVMTKGYWFNSHSITVSKACSTSVSHSIHSDNGTTTQGAKYLYSTKLLALKGLRNDIEEKAALSLAKVDKMIEECMKDENSTNN